LLVKSGFADELLENVQTLTLWVKYSNTCSGQPHRGTFMAETQNYESLLYREAEKRWREKGRGKKQLLKSIPKWMNEWVTHINDCCDGLTYCSSVSG